MNAAALHGDPIGSEKFYVYLHSKPDGDIFYVGKGCGKRAYDFKSNRNPHFIRTVKKIGPMNVGVEIFACGSEAEALSTEVDIIAVLRRANHPLVNLTNGGDGVSGYVQSIETRAKLFAANKGRVLSAEHRANISAAHMGRVFSAERKQNISQALTGRKSAPFTDEAKRNMSLALTGRPVSEATKQKLSASLTGKKHTTETRAKLSKIHTGKPWSEARRKSFEEKKNVKSN